MNKYEIEDAIRDYQMNLREIKRLRNLLGGTGERLVGQYGIESGQPNPKGNTSDPVYMETARREKQWRRLKRLEEKVRFVQEHIDMITEDRERTVLDCMLDGMSYVSIGHHMGLSRRHVQNLKESIVEQMSKEKVLV